MPAPSIGEVIFWAVVVGVFLALPIMTKLIKGRRQTLRIAAEREADAILRDVGRDPTRYPNEQEQQVQVVLRRLRASQGGKAKTRANVDANELEQQPIVTRGHVLTPDSPDIGGIDARDVLVEYGRVLGKRRHVIRDAADLPYPKAVIKTVLEHCLKIGGDAETVGHLKSVYVSLADFQTLSEAEKQAISVWERLPDASQLSDQETRSLAGTIDTHGDVYQALTVRWQNEAQALMRELSN